jgi:Arylsulfotransferase (ASST)
MPRLRAPSRSTRPWLLLFAVGVAGAYLAGLVSPAVLGVTNGIFMPPPLRSTGVVTYDRLRADTGYVVDGVINDRTVQLISKDGKVVHSWHLPYPLEGTATMDADGSLTYIGLLPKWAADRADQPGLGGAAGLLQRLTWDSQVVWTFTDEDIHHDFTELPDGTLATLRMQPVPAAEAAQVLGGAPGTEQRGTMWADQIVEVDPKTRAERVVFDVAKAWSPQDHPLPDFLPRAEWTHANGIFYTQSDPITHQEAYLVSFREVSTLLLVARRTGQIIWSYGGPWVLDQQHDPTLLANGDVLVFDDGQYLRLMPSASRVLQVDPRSNKVVWSYQGYGLLGTSFYSAIGGGAQRLSNGDTLVTLSLKGQIVEVTSDGRIVWDYRNTMGPPDPKYPGLNLSVVFKARSYAPSEVDPLLGG